MQSKIDYLVVYKGEISKLPPLLTLISLIRKKQRSITLLIDKLDNELAIVLRKIDINIIELNLESYTSNTKINKLRYWWNFRTQSKIHLKQLEYTKLWFGSADTAINLYGLYDQTKFNINVYELYDTNTIYKFFLNKILPKSEKIIVPEENRASIFKVWYKLKNKPIVLPNKPLPNTNDIKIDLSNQVKLALNSNKKTILYQGIIVKGLRDLTPLAKAIENLRDKWQLVLMGPKNSYIDELTEICPELIYIPYIKSPNHLKVTELVDVCIVSYSYKDLNNIFCAPNKIWEYSMFGKPMLCNDVPCLRQTVEKYDAGICIDMENTNVVVNALNTIETNYEKYSNNSFSFYNSIDLDKIIDGIIDGDSHE